MYQPYEVEISQRCLQAIIPEVGEPVCVLGGWAVYLTVGENFRREHGRDYIGSRDIDLGFHIERDWGRSELERSAFALAMKALERMGYGSLGFRLVKHFHVDTEQELSEEDARRIPPYQMFDLYVDPIVDYIHPMAREVFGFVPIDEPLLERVFVGHMCRDVELFGRHVLLPLPEVMLATKLRSVGQRNKEYKRVKDVADIYVISWYSDDKLPTLKGKLASIVPPQETGGVIERFTIDDLNAASSVLGIEAFQVKRVLSELGSRPSFR